MDAGTNDPLFELREIDFSPLIVHQLLYPHLKSTFELVVLLQPSRILHFMLTGKCSFFAKKVD